MTPPLDAVLWDFGGVFSGSPFHGVEAYAAQLGTTAAVLSETVLGYAEPDGDHPWHRVERGEIAFDTALEAVKERTEASGIEGFSVREFFRAMGGTGATDHSEAMFAAVGRVRDHGVRNAILSNNIKELSQRWRSRLPDGLFDLVIDSSEVGVRKPDPAIYHIALERLGRPDPHRVAFLDDYEGNVRRRASSASGGSSSVRTRLMPSPSSRTSVASRSPAERHGVTRR